MAFCKAKTTLFSYMYATRQENKPLLYVCSLFLLNAYFFKIRGGNLNLEVPEKDLE